MIISQEDGILMKNLHLSKQMVHPGCCMNSQTKVGNLKASIVIDSLPARQVQLSGNYASVDRVRRVAVDDFVLSQEDKPKRHRSAREISHETSILCSSVHRIIHRNLQLKCFKRCRAQLLPEANRISRLTR